MEKINYLGTMSQLRCLIGLLIHKLSGNEELRRIRVPYPKQDLVNVDVLSI